MSGWQLERLGEYALLLRLGDSIDAATNTRVHALAARIAAHRPSWLRDLVPAYASLAVFVDGDACIDNLRNGSVDPLAEAEAWLHALGDETNPVADTAGKLIEIPVHYGGDDGPDLAVVAEQAGLTPDDTIALHAAGDYTVAMLGFAPGFPYLIGLDPRLATPRLDAPRIRVPAGSIGIGGMQTGIYPRSSPGGWRLIGRTAMTLFDPNRDPPTMLAPGDRVRFVATERKR